MTPSERRARFRAVLAGTACVYPASVFDPVSARIAQDLGYETAMMAGSIASMTVLGAPDLIVLTLTEFADQARRIGRAASIPLLVDADHGYGNALNVKRTVEELENAGIAALTIEDTELPQAYGVSGTRLIPVAEGVGKMKAALAGRSDSQLVVIGRTSAPAVSGVAETVTRIKAYADAGIDAMFLAGVRTLQDLDVIAAVSPVPLLLAAASGPIADAAALAARKVRVALLGHQPFAAAVQAVHDTMKAMRAGTPPGEVKRMASAEMLKAVTRETDYRRWTKEFLGA